MNDMSGTIIAKSDQINACDLLAGSITMTIREVQIKTAGSDDQPVSIYFEGEKKAFRPCKGVRRLLVHAWGPDANNYISRSLTLFCDPSVTWAGKEEGGIRVSHMSNIEGEFVFSMRTSRTATKPYRIKPLVAEKPRQQTTTDPAEKWANGYIAAVESYTTAEKVNKFANDKAGKLAELEAARPDLHKACVEALDAKRASFGQPDNSWDDDFDDPNADSGGRFDDTPEGKAEANDTIAEVESLADQFRAEIAAAEDVETLNEIQQRFADSKGEMKGVEITDVRGKLAERRNELAEDI